MSHKNLVANKVVIVIFLFISLTAGLPGVSIAVSNVFVDFSDARGVQVISPEQYEMADIAVSFLNPATQEILRTVNYGVVWEFNYNTLTLDVASTKTLSPLPVDGQRIFACNGLKCDKGKGSSGVNDTSKVVKSFGKVSGDNLSLDFRRATKAPVSNPGQYKMKNIIVSVGPGEPENAITTAYNVLWEFNYETMTLDAVSIETWDEDDIPEPPAEICERPVDLVDTSIPDYIVGDGSPGSCTEAALDRAILNGGIITFNCGTEPVTITVTSEKKITKNMVIDGGGLVTLSGGGTTRILNMDNGNFELQYPNLTVQRLTFKDARATGTLTRLGYDIDGGGGAIYYYGGSVTVIDSVFINNVAAEIGPDAAGGAVYGVGVGETIIVGSTIVGNRAANGGAVGALHTGLSIVNTTITDNIAMGYGANYQDENNEQQGHGGNGGAIVMDGNGRTLNLCGLTIKDNISGALGGAVFRTGYETEPSIIDRTVVDGNRTLLYEDTELPNGAGALYLQGNHVTLTNSTISNNAAHFYVGVWILSHGDAPGIADLTNVTITGNYAYPKDTYTERGIGGGIIIEGDVTGTVQNCTILNNSTQFASGIINVTPLVVNNTIIANEVENIWVPFNCTGTDFNTPPGNGEYNLQWPDPAEQYDDMECTYGIMTGEPLLNDLADNGGPTMTMAPMEGSPALKAGWNCPATDQRGMPRSEPCTLGAYEAD